MRLLYTILDMVFPPRTQQRLVQEQNEASLVRHVRIRQVTPGVYALLSYRTPLVQACVLEAKFFGNKKAHQILGRTLAHGLSLLPIPAEIPAKAVRLVPIPLSQERLKQRGYNQVTEILTHSYRLNQLFPIEHQMLVKTKDTVPQTSLGRAARLKNTTGAFAVSYKPDPQYLYIVIDDVVTTGATLRAATQALRDAGASVVYAVALAQQTSHETFDDMPAMTYSAETRRRD